MSPLLQRFGLTAIIAASLGLPALAVEDAPPIDTTQLMALFKAAKEAQASQSRAMRQKVLQEATAAASNPSRGADLWEQAIQATRFDGVAKESTAFRDWKEKEGDALRDKEILNALRLHFNWLAITLQKLNGAKTHDLLPAIIQHTKEATAHHAMMEAFEENVKKEKELAASGKHGARDKEKKTNDESVRSLSRQLLNDPVANSVFTRWMKLDENINDAFPRKGQAADGGSWEQAAGNVDGIFERIILPDLREQKDPRVLEYWDVRLKKEADAVTKSKLSFDIEKFNTINRPKLLWQRALDMKVVGQRNKALGEMVNLIKTYPTHPDAAGWIAAVEQEISPAPSAAAPAATSSSATPAVAAPAAAAAVRTP